MTGSRRETGLSLKILDTTVSGTQKYVIENSRRDTPSQSISSLNEREKEIIKKGGLLPYTRAKVT